MLCKVGDQYNLYQPHENGEGHYIVAKVYEDRRLAVLCDHVEEIWDALRHLLVCPDLNVDELDDITVPLMDRACAIEKMVLQELKGPQ